MILSYVVISMDRDISTKRKKEVIFPEEAFLEKDFKGIASRQKADMF